MIAAIWWGIGLPCSKCKEACTLSDVMYSSDGELCFIFVCHRCKEEYRWRVFTTALIRQALVNDLEKNAREKKPPQKLLPPLKEDHAKDDAEFLHQNGISPEDAQ